MTTAILIIFAVSVLIGGVFAKEFSLIEENKNDVQDVSISSEGDEEV